MFFSSTRARSTISTNELTPTESTTWKTSPLNMAINFVNMPSSSTMHSMVGLSRVSQPENGNTGYRIVMGGDEVSKTNTGHHANDYRTYIAFTGSRNITESGFSGILITLQVKFQ